jgi:endonuclease YncB( thermonuclease family)
MTVRSVYRTLICLFAFILPFSFVPSASFARTIEGKVVHIADGDKITVTLGSTLTGRMVGTILI